jgi:2-keto-4-pentenoate hydratase
MSAPRSLLAMLREARAGGGLIARLAADDTPADLDAAYAVAAQLAEHRGPVAGWKVGATSPGGQALLGLSEPFFGRIFADVLWPDAAVIECGAGSIAIEPEVALLLSQDVPPRALPYAPEEVAEAVAAVGPALEINRPSFLRPLEVGGLALIADNGVNAGACIGAWRTDWRVLGIDTLTVRVMVDRNPSATGGAGSVHGGPLGSLTWLANALSRRDCGLSAGQIVLSGALTRPLDLVAGQRIEATFEGLGSVRMSAAPDRCTGAGSDSGTKVMPDA